MSYIIKNNQLVAKIERTMKSGCDVQYSALTSVNALNANREKDLVNAVYATVSNARKWDTVYARSGCGIAIEINEGEFLI